MDDTSVESFFDKNDEVNIFNYALYRTTCNDSEPSDEDRLYNNVPSCCTGVTQAEG